MLRGPGAALAAVLILAHLSATLGWGGMLPSLRPGESARATRCSWNRCASSRVVKGVDTVSVC
jgi:hypothetical protein